MIDLEGSIVYDSLSISFCSFASTVSGKLVVDDALLSSMAQVAVAIDDLLPLTHLGETHFSIPLVTKI